MRLARSSATYFGTGADETPGVPYMISNGIRICLPNIGKKDVCPVVGLTLVL